MKILIKAGTSYAKFSIPASEDLQARIKVYNLVDGEIVDKKVKSDNIFKERITDDYYIHHFAIPNIKVGSVFDIEYKQPLLPNSFSFQELIPIKHAELKLQHSTDITFNKRSIGFEKFETIAKDHFIRQDRKCNF